MGDKVQAEIQRESGASGGRGSRCNMARVGNRKFGPTGPWELAAVSARCQIRCASLNQRSIEGEKLFYCFFICSHLFLHFTFLQISMVRHTKELAPCKNANHRPRSSRWLLQCCNDWVRGIVFAEGSGIGQSVKRLGFRWDDLGLIRDGVKRPFSSGVPSTPFLIFSPG